MWVKVKLLGPQRDTVRRSRLELEVKPGDTIADVLAQLQRTYGEAFTDLADQEKSSVIILYRGEIVHDVKQLVEDGAEIVILPAMGGG